MAYIIPASDRLELMNYNGLKQPLSITPTGDIKPERKAKQVEMAQLVPFLAVRQIFNL